MITKEKREKKEEVKGLINEIKKERRNTIKKKNKEVYKRKKKENKLKMKW